MTPVCTKISKRNNKIYFFESPKIKETMLLMDFLGKQEMAAMVGPKPPSKWRKIPSGLVRLKRLICVRKASNPQPNPQEMRKLISKNFVILLFCKCFICFESLLSILNHLLSYLHIIVKSQLFSKVLSLSVEKFHRSKQRLSDFI